jgi:CheY-like chemotaxis protein
MSPNFSSPPRRVLVVEDNPDCREALRLLLESWGYQADVAADGREGLAKALAWRPEVAVVDIGLPILDGFRVARQVRDALGDHVHLIALTAFSAAEDRRQALAAGFDHFLTKPVDLDELAHLVAP